MATPYSRTRISSDTLPVTLSGYDEYTSPSTFAQLDYTGQLGSGWETSVMSDVVTPDWALKRTSGMIINNPMSLARKSFRYGVSSYVITRDQPPVGSNVHIRKVLSGSYGAYLDYYSLPVGLPSYMDPLTSPVVLDEEHFIKLAGIKARTGISPILVQSLVSVVELPKTLALITSSLNTLRQIRKSVVTGNPDYALRAIGNQRKGRVKVSADFSRKTVHDRWLEFRYGWTPLVFEAQGAIKALNRPRTGKPVRATSRGFENVKMENDSTTFQWVNNPNGTFHYRFFREVSAKVRAYVLYTADLEHQQARDFGVSEFPLAFWELVPYSFVVDWFVNVGNWIEALTPKLGIKVLAEGYTLEKTTTVKRVVDAWTPSTGTTTYTFSGTWKGTPDVYTEYQKTRVPNLGVLLSLPPLNVRLDKKRVLDAIALLSKRF